ncbi:hypothetical protein Q1695_016402 [Nippostrongylus brasiliensis]|nr:hypothetical protein Q1695_016402 [Nippostrongylus brasiliensis]
MSLITLHEATVANSTAKRASVLLHCRGRNCRDLLSVEVPQWNTLGLRVAEMAVVGATLFINVLLIVAIVSARRLLVSPFYKLFAILAAVFLVHCSSVMVLKLIPIFLPYSFKYQSEISLYIDIFVKCYSIQLIFILTLHRSMSFLAKRMSELLFMGWRQCILPSASFLLSAAMAVVVMVVDKMHRKYVSWLGYADYAESTIALTVLNYFCLVITFFSIILHFFIYSWMRNTNKNFMVSEESRLNKAERVMLLQAILTTTIELVFLIFFIVIPTLQMRENDLYLIVSLYNILCSIPELLMPLFVLFISRDIKQSLGQIIAVQSIEMHLMKSVT